MSIIDFDIAKLQLSNGKTIEAALKEESDRLLYLLQAAIDEWYSSYLPVEYDRTYQMRNSVSVGGISTKGNQLSAAIVYDDNAFHDSLWGNDRVNVLLLDNFGYSVSSGWHKDIENFGWRSPGGFIEKAIEEFNATSKYGFKAEIAIEDF